MTGIGQTWRIRVCEQLAVLKGAAYGTCRVSSVSGASLTLTPFTAEMVANDALIEALTRWRTENICGFTKLFRPSFEGTRSWSRSQLIERPDRILFLVLDAAKHPIGHVGLSTFDFDAGTCEIDNVVRGEQAAPPGTMTEAVATLLEWAYSTLGPAEVRLRTLTENTRALALYHRLGFVPLSLIPLRRVEEDHVTEWVQTGIGPADRFFLLMVHRPSSATARGVSEI